MAARWALALEPRSASTLTFAPIVLFLLSKKKCVEKSSRGFHTTRFLCMSLAPKSRGRRQIAKGLRDLSFQNTSVDTAEPNDI